MIDYLTLVMLRAMRARNGIFLWLVAACLLLPPVSHAGEIHEYDRVYDGMQCEPCGTTFFCSGVARFACPDHSATEFSHENL